MSNDLVPQSVSGILAASEAAPAPAAVYPILAQHQRDESWHGRNTIAFLQAWAARFIVEFKLEIPEMALCLEPLSKDRYAHFRPGHNGFGLRGEIAFNTRYLVGERQIWEILGTLLHELLHGWQQAHGVPGKRNHHNSEFRQKAWDLGLIVDRKGVTGYRAMSQFKTLLACHEITAPEEQIIPKARKSEGHSKLKKWSCRCTPPVNVRVAIANFRALCLVCGWEFARADLGT